MATEGKSRDQKAQPSVTGAQSLTSEPVRPASPAGPWFFLRELNRRNVVRVGVLYLVVCWVILEPVHVVFHMLEVPAWANRLVILLMAVGLPAALLFAWVYELTPRGLKLTTEVDLRHSITEHTGRRLDRAIIVVLTVALAYFVVDKFWLSRSGTAPGVALSASQQAAPGAPLTGGDNSIAVLPFVDMSEKRDQEYFSDGLAEELIDLLSQTPDLRVIARTSSFQFKSRSEDVRSIAHQLGVTNLLEGSVRKAGGTVRVTAQLIKATDGSHLWSETYDRQLEDVFKVQDDICGTVVKALKVKLAPARAQVRPHNMEAYNALLRGKYFAERFTKEDDDRAVALLQEAIRLDPDYAQAWVELAQTQLAQLREAWTGVSEEEGYARVQTSVEQALRLDPKLPRAHGIRGEILMERDFDWTGAQAEFALDPDSTETQERAARVTHISGQLEESIAQLRHTLLRDPLSTETHWSLGMDLLHAGRAEEAEAELRKLLELHPLAARTHYGLGLTLIARGRHAEALEAMEREPDDGWRKCGLPLAYWALGRRAEADAALETVKAQYAQAGAYQIAEIYAYRGDANLAFEWLDRAYRQRDPGMSWVTTDHFFRDLRSDPRYLALLARLKLPQTS
jgi:adenylate cyclase